MKRPFNKKRLPSKMTSASDANILACVTLEHLLRIYKTCVMQDLKEQKIAEQKKILSNATDVVTIGTCHKLINENKIYFDKRIEDCNKNNSEMMDIFIKDDKSDGIVEFLGDIMHDGMTIALKYHKANKNYKLALLEEDENGDYEAGGDKYNVLTVDN